MAVPRSAANAGKGTVTKTLNKITSTCLSPAPDAHCSPVSPTFKGISSFSCLRRRATQRASHIDESTLFSNPIDMVRRVPRLQVPPHTSFVRTVVVIQALRFAWVVAVVWYEIGTFFWSVSGCRWPDKSLQRVCDRLSLMCKN